ncbi:hypothetical protein KM043_013978 [Ampulex compressa]|nr:hypothetical protein KM043_013978 [Ampulex compressa]
MLVALTQKQINMNNAIKQGLRKLEEVIDSLEFVYMVRVKLAAGASIQAQVFSERTSGKLCTRSRHDQKNSDKPTAVFGGSAEESNTRDKRGCEMDGGPQEDEKEE